jgi:ribosomal protein S18 acetylase RimI-like enzyme
MLSDFGANYDDDGQDGSTGCTDSVRHSPDLLRNAASTMFPMAPVHAGPSCEILPRATTVGPPQPLTNHLCGCCIRCTWTERMSDLDIRRARFEDVALLAGPLGDEALFADRLDRQHAGHGVLFVAWASDLPVGVVYLWLQDAEEEPIRVHLPGVALLTHLEVRDDHRNLGIGTTLVRTVERFLRDDGHGRVALAVREDNADAARLYRRLGYRNWGHGDIVCLTAEWLPGEEMPRREPEICHVMVRQLGADRILVDLGSAGPAVRSTGEAHALVAAHESQVGQHLLDFRPARSAVLSESVRVHPVFVTEPVDVASPLPAVIEPCL